MKRALFTATLVVVALAGSYVSGASAADQKMVRGTISSVGAKTVTIAAGSQQMTFAVDANTHVEAPGAGTKSRAAQASGKPGAAIGDLLKAGQSVEIAYDDHNGTMSATSIRRISNMAAADPAGGSEARGKVTAVSGSSLTIAGSSRGATFTQTYAIDPATHVIGKGIGTATASKGGRAAITDLVAVGDSVSVSYRPGNGALNATEVRVVK